MTPKKLEIIKCPKCNYEYLPGEIFLPNSFIGQPYAIMRDENGKIIDYAGKSMDLHETFTCENCNTTFNLRTQLQFFTEIKDNINFAEDYVTSLKKQSLFLDEE